VTFIPQYERDRLRTCQNGVEFDNFMLVAMYSFGVKVRYAFPPFTRYKKLLKKLGICVSAICHMELKCKNFCLNLKNTRVFTIRCKKYNWQYLQPHGFTLAPYS
jgi:hypothetical protein